ncbi:MAG: hypothetical protein ACRDMV_23825, partial [Streptosporangiales bacterium]
MATGTCRLGSLLSPAYWMPWRKPWNEKMMPPLATAANIPFASYGANPPKLAKLLVSKLRGHQRRDEKHDDGELPPHDDVVEADEHPHATRF